MSGETCRMAGTLTSKACLVISPLARAVTGFIFISLWKAYQQVRPRIPYSGAKQRNAWRYERRSSRAVADDHGLTQALGQLLRDHARKQIRFPNRHPRVPLFFV